MQNNILFRVLHLLKRVTFLKMHNIHKILIAIFLITTQLNAQDEVAIGIEEKLDQYLPNDITLTDINGENINLLDLIDKPTILSFVYFRCPGICTPLMDGIADVVGLSDLELGQDYQVLTISFDPTEGPEMAKKKRNNYSLLVKKEGLEKGWLFFTADSANVKKATESVGFNYKKVGNEYTHTASLIFVSPDGKITRYLNGTYFLPFEVKMAVLESSKGQSGPTINKVLQFCYSFDPAGKTYVLNITKVSATVIIFIAIVVLLFLFIKPKRKQIKTNQ